MGVYNPHIPRILGQEWVPIREEDTVFSPAVNVVELGHSFTATASRTLQDARFYVNKMPPSTDRGQTYMAAIYAAGTEERSGPVQRVVIPCNAAAMSGGTLSSASTAVQALLTQSTSSGISLDTSIANSGVIMNFAVGQYPQLNGKRILGVNLLLGGSGTADIFGAGSNSASAVYMSTGVAVNPSTPFSLFGRFGEGSTVFRIKFGEINQFWTANSPTSVSERMPWTYSQLLRLDTTATRLFVNATTGTSVNIGTIAGSSSCFLFYAALEVLFCEEQRLVVGAAQFGTTFTSSSFGKDTVLGVNILTLRDLSYTANPVLAAGDYTVTLSSADVGSLNDNTAGTTSDFSDLNALRELYPMPNQPGVEVDLPFPMDETAVGKEFIVRSTSVLPQLSVHASGGPLTEVHVYGRQAVAQVYGTVTATQEIYDAGLTSATYPGVRYYARRFGDTTVPLTLTGVTQSVSITPGAFDALDEILDGWKEVTLRFSTAPTLGAGTNPQFVWSATSELVGNRWEVLGAIAPALSGTPGNLQTLVPSPNQLSIATYGQPVSGAGINMGWIPQYAPPVTATADDQTSDAVLFFGQDPPAISGFAITQLNQALSGIGLNCGLAPQFIPTALAYNQLAWSVDQTNIVSDTFTRSVASGWGTATSGQVWTASGGSATDFNVNGTMGTVLLSSTGVYRITRLATFSVKDVDAYAEIASNTAAVTLDHWGALAIRDDGTGNQWYGQIKFNPTGTVQLLLTTVTASVHTNLGTITIANSYTVNTKVKMRLRAEGSRFLGRAWMDGETEPDEWLLDVVSTANNVAGVVTTRSISGAGNPITVVISYDNILVSSTSNGYTELQRQDSLTSWQTIMKATNQAVASFNDYEARVALQSDYRVRYVSIYGFAGPWSATVSSTITAPGVTATGMSASDHVWIFTTNSVQAGTSNLAYCLGWNGEVTEDFNFPEASGQAYQTMYGRDFVTVFRPSERGGTNFSRTLLVQAAAISPETLEDFTSLRNMAWVDVPFICLRDEDGNRWFANVSVPSGVVQRDRRLYLAPVTIVEVTDTPTPVSP